MCLANDGKPKNMSAKRQVIVLDKKKKISVILFSIALIASIIVGFISSFSIRTSRTVDGGNSIFYNYEEFNIN